MANTYSLDLELSSSQYAYINDNANLSITGDISLEAWIKLEQLPSTAGTAFCVAGKFTADTGKRSYLLEINTSDKLVLTWSSDGSTENTQTADAATFAAGDVGDWVHVAATLDVSGPTAVLYKNASLVASTKSGTQTAIVDNAEAFAIGARDLSGTPAKFLDGKIDEVRVWNDIRSGAEILANYQTEIDPASGNLIAYYKLNNDYLDETANNNDLTASGSPVFSSDRPFDVSSGFFAIL